MKTATDLASEEPQTAGFFGSRWRGEAYLNKLFWRDMLMVGSVINLLSGFSH